MIAGQNKIAKGEKFSAAIIAFLFACGVIYHLIPALNPLVIKSTSFVLIVTNLVVIYYLIRLYPCKKLKLWLGGAFIISFLCEVIGVKTGLIFGTYSYTDILKPSLFSVPVIIGLNWVILALAGYVILSELKLPPFLVSPLNALLITLFDFNMEPVAINLNYWQWPGNIVPVKNYISWFVIVLTLSVSLQLFKIRPNSFLLKVFLIIQAIFFLCLNCFLD